MNSCGNCDKPARLFKSGKPQLWCSEPCRKERLAKDAKAARADNPRPRAQFNCVCQLCSAPFVALYPRAKWCSRRCSSKAQNSRFKRASATRRCAVCEGAYRPRRDDRTPTCSRSCSKRYPSLFKPESPAPFSSLHALTCRCGRMFLSRFKRSACSDACAKAMQSEKNKVRNMEKRASFLVSRPCKHCGALFTPEYGAKNRAFCSKRCARRASRAAGGKCHRKRARRFGVQYEPVNPIKVFERDGWRCQICAKETPRNRRGTRYSNAPELDHRIPISNGGPHTYDNVQCACRACNHSKSNLRSSGQIGLFAATHTRRANVDIKRAMRKAEIDVAAWIGAAVNSKDHSIIWREGMRLINNGRAQTKGAPGSPER